MPNDGLINYVGRFEYLTALKEHWPDVLRSLRDDVLPSYQKYLGLNKNMNRVTSLQGLRQAEDLSPEYSAVGMALNHWAQSYALPDSWLLDAGVGTLRNWSQGQDLGKWFYVPEELNTPQLNPEFGVWIPPLMKWKEFKKASERIYKQEMVDYRKTVSRLWGVGKKSLGQQAVWTVLWQCQKSPEWIRNRELRVTGRSVTVANIQMRVHEFAQGIGLTLREGKSGPLRGI